MPAPEPQSDPASHRAAVEACLLVAMPMLRRYALKLSRNSSLADDLVQDVAVNVLKGAHSFSFDAPGSGFDKWAAVVMRNAWVAQVRRGHRMRLGDVDDVAILMQNDLRLSAGGEESAAAKIDLCRLDSCMATLPQHQREVLFVIAIRGAKYEEAVEMFGIPIGTIKTRMRRARCALAACMGYGEY